MAYLSHLPQLTASALMDVVGERQRPSGLRLAGRGLVDTTRLASSPADVWRDICAANAGDIGHALDRLIARLTGAARPIYEGRDGRRVFERAARWRAELMKGRELTAKIGAHHLHAQAWDLRSGRASTELDVTEDGRIHPLFDSRPYIWSGDPALPRTHGPGPFAHRPDAPAVPGSLANLLED